MRLISLHQLCHFVTLVGILASCSDGPLMGDEGSTVHLRSNNIKDMLSLGDVETVEAEAYNIPDLYGREPSIPRFLIPAELQPEVLSLLSNPQVDVTPAIAIREIATLKVKYKDGTIRTIVCFWTGGKGPLHFSVNGIRCIAERQKPEVDAGLTLTARIRRIYEDKSP